MGNLVTKIMTNNIELNESDVSDVIFTQVAKASTPAGPQTRTGMFKNIFNYDPRSPSTGIMRTPIAIFRSNANAKKFNHQELNESVESQIDLNILTQEEQDSLDSNGEMVTIEDVAKLKLADPRSPVDPEIETELTRTPIISSDVKTKKEDNLMKKITEKLISANLDDNKPTEDKPKKSRTKNLIYEDGENTDRYSTPPKKSLKDELNARTPLGCLGNTPTFTASTPKSKQMIGNQSSASRIPVSARRLH